MMNGVNTSQKTYKKLKVVEIMKSLLNVRASALKTSCPFPYRFTSFQFHNRASSFCSTSYTSGMTSKSYCVSLFLYPLDTRGLTHEKVSLETSPAALSRSSSRSSKDDFINLDVY